MKHLVFLHIPKSAGTTVRLRIKEAFEATSSHYIELGVYNHNHWYRPRDFHNIDIPENWSFIYGHITAQKIFENAAIRRDAAHTIFMSFVRDPLDRLISTYNYIATNNRHPLHEKCLGTDQSDFFKTLSKSEQNLQYRYLMCDQNTAARFIVAPSDRVGETCAEAFAMVTGQEYSPSFFDKKLNVTRSFSEIGKARKLSRASFSERQILDFYEWHSKDAALYDLVVSQRVFRTNPVWLLE